MNRDDALIVMSILNMAFPNEALEQATVQLWTQILMECHNAEAATEAALTIVKTGTRFPSIADYRAVYRAKAEQLRRPELEPPTTSSRGIPEWVLVWRWARFQRDPKEGRPFPQQYPHHEPPYLTQDEYAMLQKEWRAADSPGKGLKPDEILVAP